MGLDAYLYQFKGVDTNAIVELSRFSDEPWAYQSRHSLSEEERKAEFQEYQSKIIAKAKDLGLPDSVATDPNFGGVEVRFPSEKYPGCEFYVGDWDSWLFFVESLLSQFTSKDLYYVFPEAIGDPHFIAPDWLRAKTRLSELLAEIKNIDPKRFEELCPSYITKDDTDYIGVMIETIDYVLSQPKPKEFLLYWST